MMARVLLIDNYDSFTYNLFQYMSELGAEVTVKRNDEVDLEWCIKYNPDRVMISPGPGSVKDGGISCDVIRHFAGKVPVFGVCLGHQSIFEVYGGTVSHAPEIMHGKPSVMEHDGRGVFQDLAPDFQAIRYHSLVGLPETLPEELEVSCRVKGSDMIMGVRHKKLQVEGVQFHPESIGSEEGKKMVQNFLAM